MEKQELKDKALYQYDEETDSFKPIEPSKIPKIPVENEEVKERLTTYRNMIQKELPHRPELSVITTILLETAMENDVSEVVERVKAFFRERYS